MRTRVLVALLGIACAPPVGTEAHHHEGHIALSTAASQTPARVSGPYVSVLDSVVLTMTPESGSQVVLGRHLSRRDTTASFSVSLPEGSVGFDAKVLSAKLAVLFAGTASSVVDRDGFSVDLSVATRTAVMLVAPDTSSVVVPVSGAPGQTTLSVHNRGTGVLSFNIYDTSQVSRAQCANVCFRFSKLAGTVTAGTSDSVRIDVLRKFTTPIPLTFSSQPGDVQVVIRTP